jgi:uncharacterized protein (DUF3820 family)
MLPNIYAILRANATVLSTVGTRIYRHGAAPQDVVKPYITWFVISGIPESLIKVVGALSCRLDTSPLDTIIIPLFDI